MQCYIECGLIVVVSAWFQSAICADMQCYRRGYLHARLTRLVSVRYLRGYAVLRPSNARTKAYFRGFQSAICADMQCYKIESLCVP